MRKTVNGKRARTGSFFVFRFEYVRPLPSNIYAESGISVLCQLPGTLHYNGTGNCAHYRLAYADFRSGAWTVAPYGGEEVTLRVHVQRRIIDYALINAEVFGY